MNRITRTRWIAAVVAVSRPLAFTALNGIYAALVNAGQLIQGSTFLGRLGLTDEQIRSTRSWFGRYAAKAWRTSKHTEPRRVWADIDGRWTEVAVYEPASPVLPAAVRAYKRLRTMLPTFDLCA